MSGREADAFRGFARPESALADSGLALGSERLRRRLDRSRFSGYLYAYPHKTAYRPLEPPVALADAWREEALDRVFLYLHVPFCEMRCGFCNLFTMTGAPPSSVGAYIETLERQADVVRSALSMIGDDLRVARLAIGGGTPTYLEAEPLDRLFEIAGAWPGSTDRSGRLAVPCSVETSPRTATSERLAVLANRGVSRVSIGVQSYLEDEVRAVGRSQRTTAVVDALDRIREHPFALNIDLMYGLPGQTPATWQTSLESALRHEPEEVFVYPLYVRPKTGLSRSGVETTERVALYRQARDVLLEAGYDQASMRAFRRGPAAPAPVYCCQTDGMIGLGPGARSYTTALHYSTPWAVTRAAVARIVEDWTQTDTTRFAHAWHGIHLTEEEQRRRFVIMSLLHAEGLDLDAYEWRFQSSVFTDLPGLHELVDDELAVIAMGDDSEVLCLTSAGFERSDAIGPWLVSEKVARRMRLYQVT